MGLIGCSTGNCANGAAPTGVAGETLPEELGVMREEVVDR
jgi:hypothetical protein